MHLFVFADLHKALRLHRKPAHQRGEAVELPAPGDAGVAAADMAEIAKACWERLPYYGLFCLGQCGLILHKLLQFVPCHVMSKEELSRVEQCTARLSRLLQFVDDNYMHKIRLADFARQEGRTVSYMSHFVRDTMNQTFQEYVNSVRFNHARKLIATTSDPLVNICFESGFSDYRYFSQVFQQVYGMTPAEYRKQYQSVSSEQFLPAKSIHSRELIYSSAESLTILKDFLEKTPYPDLKMGCRGAASHFLRNRLDFHGPPVE